MTVKDRSHPSDTFQAQQVLRPRAQVEKQIREAILRGDFSQGDKLPSETDLAQQFGVSRPTVREALGSLVTAGLIRKIPGVAGGSFVNSVTPDSLSTMLGESMDNIVRLGSLDIDELTAMRRVLEVPAASWAAESATAPSHLALLEGIVERQRTRIGRRPGDRGATTVTSTSRSLTHPATGCSRPSSPRSTTPPDQAQSLCVTPHVGRSTLKQHLAIARAIRSGFAAERGGRHG